MKSCGFAGDCRNVGSTLVRIPGVGDRRICAEHVAWMTAVGMDFRLIDDTFVPRWRLRSLAKDDTGRLLA